MRTIEAAGDASIGLRGVLSVAGAIAIVAAVSAAAQWATPQPSKSVRSGHVVLTNDWHEQISQPSFWRSYNTQQRASLGRGSDREDDDEERPARLEEQHSSRPSVQSGSYRTVCVRLCDGYYFPISFGTTRDRFMQDAAKCESSCRSPAKLFVYPNVGGDPEEMQDVDGNPYKDLPRAFLFRTKYDASCTCKPHPWEQEARDLHKRYAAEAQTPAGVVAATQTPGDGALGAGSATPRASLIQAAGTDRSPRSRRSRSASAERRSTGSRPDGAMMLGARSKSAEKPQRSAPRASAPKMYGRRNDWRTQAFRGD